MRKILVGEVATTTKAGYATVRIADPNARLQLGHMVVDEYGREIGRLIDIIGRVEEPFAVIRTNANEELVGRKVFLVIPEKRGGRRGRKKRRGARKSVREKPVAEKPAKGVSQRKDNRRRGERGKGMRRHRRSNRRAASR